MLNIEGVIQIIPLSIATDAGTMRVGEDTEPEPAIVLAFATASGVVQVVLPEKHKDSLVRAIENASEEARAAKSDIVIAKDSSGIKEIAEAQEKIKGPQEE